MKEEAYEDSSFTWLVGPTVDAKQLEGKAMQASHLIWAVALGGHITTGSLYLQYPLSCGEIVVYVPQSQMWQAELKLPR